MPTSDPAIVRRVENALAVPITKVDDAISLLADGQAICAGNGDLARRAARHVLTFLRGIVSTDKVHQHLGGRGTNLNVAEVTCHEAMNRVSVLEEQGAIGLIVRPAAWDAPINAVRAAHEYLLILNGELQADRSALVKDVEEISDAAMRMVVGTTVTIVALPLVVAFVAEAGSVGVATMASRLAYAGLSRVLTFCITNPTGALEVANFALGTVFSIGMAGGMGNWLRSLSTSQGAIGTLGDVVVLFVALRTGAPVPAGRPAPPPAQLPPLPPPRAAPAPQPPPAFLRVEAKVERVDASGAQLRVTRVEPVADLPVATPPKVRTQMQRQPMLTLARPMDFNRLPDDFPMDRARQAVRNARLHPRSRAHPGSIEDTNGGVCECNAVSERLRAEFEGGTVVPAGMGASDHDVYQWPAQPKPGQPFVVMDGTAAQYTEFVAGTPAGTGKNLVPIAQLQAQGLLQCIIDGVFTPDQHKRFARLVQQQKFQR